METFRTRVSKNSLNDIFFLLSSFLLDGFNYIGQDLCLPCLISISNTQHPHADRNNRVSIDVC